MVLAVLVIVVQVLRGRLCLSSGSGLPLLLLPLNPPPWPQTNCTRTTDVLVVSPPCTIIRRLRVGKKTYEDLGKPFKNYGKPRTTWETFFSQVFFGFLMVLTVLYGNQHPDV